MVRKAIVQNEELVEEDVGREEVDMDDDTEHHRTVRRETDAHDETQRRGR